MTKVTVSVMVKSMQAVNTHINDVKGQSRVVFFVKDEEVSSFGRDHFAVFGEEWARGVEQFFFRTFKEGDTLKLTGTVSSYAAGVKTRLINVQVARA